RTMSASAAGSSGSSSQASIGPRAGLRRRHGSRWVEPDRDHQPETSQPTSALTRWARLSRFTRLIRLTRLECPDVRLFAVDRLVESGQLTGLIDTDRGHAVDEPEHAPGERERPDDGEDDRAHFGHEEPGIPREEAVGSGRVERLRREQPEHHDAERSTDAVDAPDVERVVELETVLERHRQIADRACR